MVVIHGFTQSSRSWGAFGDRLGSEHKVVAPDAPGHGKSAGVVADLWTGADLLVDAGQLHGSKTADYLGYSMGGRFALHAALRRPDAVRRLVLLSATGGIDDPHERAARRASDQQLAARVEREGVAAFVQWWLARPLFATLPTDAAAVDSRLGGTAAGLASSLRLAGAGSQEPLWDRLAQLSMPVLVVAGALDRPYVARAERLVDAIGPNATLTVITNAGHACHLERPDETWAAVRPFLAAGH